MRQNDDTLIEPRYYFFLAVVVDCGTACPAEEVASANILNAAEGEAIATCTQAGASSGKNSVWTLHCDANLNGKILFDISFDFQKHPKQNKETESANF